MRIHRNIEIDRESLPPWLTLDDFNMCNAIAEGDVTKVGELLENGANPNGNGYEQYHGIGIVPGSPHLFNAVYRQNTDIIELLLQYNCDINVQNVNGNILVEITSDVQNELGLDMIEYLLSKGADINYMSDLGTPIYQLATTGPDPDVEWINWFLDHGADPFVKPILPVLTDEINRGEYPELTKLMARIKDIQLKSNSV